MKGPQPSLQKYIKLSKLIPLIHFSCCLSLPLLQSYLWNQLRKGVQQCLRVKGVATIKPLSKSTEQATSTYRNLIFSMDVDDGLGIPWTPWGKLSTFLGAINSTRPPAAASVTAAWGGGGVGSGVRESPHNTQHTTQPNTIQNTPGTTLMSCGNTQDRL